MSYTQSVTGFQTFVGQSQIHVSRLQYEPDVFKRDSRGEIQYLPDGQVIVKGGLSSVFPAFRCGSRAVQHSVIEPCLHDIVMIVFYQGRSLVTLTCGYACLDIQLVCGIGQAYSHLSVFHQLFRPVYGFSVQIVQHFQSVFRFPAYGTESGRDVQSYHACSRYSHSHSVFQDISADLDLYGEVRFHPPVIVRAAALFLKDFYSLGYSQGNGYGFSAAEGRLHFFLYQFNDFRFSTVHRMKI